MTEDIHPPTHEESMAYIIEKKVDAILEDAERLGAKLQESTRRYEREFRAPDPLPLRRGGALALWLVLWALVALASGSLYAATSRAYSPVDTCVSALVFDINYSLMSSTTARRKARVICADIRRKDPSFFKALTQ